MKDSNVKVLVVDDTVTYRSAISDLLGNTPGIEVVGTAVNGRIALQKCERLQPDLMTLDLEMPEMDGLEVLRRLKAIKSPIGAIMLSAFTAKGADSTMAALELGAFDFVLKPSGNTREESTALLRESLIPKIQAYARKHLLLKSIQAPAPARQPQPPISDVAKRLASIARAPSGKPAIIALGISTGGPQALSTMMPMLPEDLPAPLLIVQHMPPMFTKSLADGLNSRCALSVYEAEDGQPARAGEALIAPGGKQMKIEREGFEAFVRITDDPPENSCRPSVDYLFRSVSHCYGSDALGVIMTGMGYDGLIGCRLLKRRGAAVLTQDEATCVVYGMPKGPADEGLSDTVAPLESIAAEIVRYVGRGVRI